MSCGGTVSICDTGSGRLSRKAREYLSKAGSLLDVVHYSDEAARTAYLAGFHAAQALVFERTARVAKSHRGLRTTVARLAKDDPRIDRSFTRFLARAYKFKEITNYGIGPQAVVTTAQAREMLGLATRFVDRMTEILS
jgi:uncharacterized protein (UPF0332 family)